MITTIENTTIETTDSYRTHWIHPITGIRYETRWASGPDGFYMRDGLRPVLNLDEVRAYVVLGLEHLPADVSVPPIEFRIPGGAVIFVGAATSVWYAHQVLTGSGTGRTEHVLVQMAAELTDDVPRYHETWRAPFVASRERFAAPPQPISA